MATSTQELLAQNVDTVQDIVRIAIDEGEPVENIPLLVSQVRHESGFNPRAVSPSGARGLGQIMPETGRVDLNLSRQDLFDPEKNIRGLIEYKRRIRDGKLFANPSDGFKFTNEGDVIEAYHQGAEGRKRQILGAAPRGPEGEAYRNRVLDDAPVVEAFLKESGLLQIEDQDNTQNQQLVQATAQAARRGSNIPEADIRKVVRVPNWGGSFAENNQFQNIPYVEQKRITDQYLNRIKRIFVGDADIVRTIQSELEDGIHEFRVANLGDPNERVLKAFDQYAQATDYYNQSEERQNFLKKKFKVYDVANVAAMYPTSMARVSDLRSKFDLALEESEFEVVSSPEAQAAREARLAAATGQSDRSYLVNAADAFNTGLANSFSSVPRAIGLLTQTDAPQRAADFIDSLVREPTDKFKETWSNSLWQGVGYVGGLVLGGAAGAASKSLGIGGRLLGFGSKATTATKAAKATADASKLVRGLKAAGTRAANQKIALTMATSAELANQLDEYYKVAEDRGEEISPVRVAGALGASLLIGATDVALGPVAKLIPGGTKFAGALDNFVVRYINKNPRVQSILASGASEAGQEALQGVMSEITSSFLQEQDVNVAEAWRQIAEEGSVGGVIGGALGMIFPGRLGPIPGVDPVKVQAEKTRVEDEAKKTGDYDATGATTTTVLPPVGGPVVGEPVVTEPVVTEPLVEPEIEAEAGPVPGRGAVDYSESALSRRFQAVKDMFISGGKLRRANDQAFLEFEGLINQQRSGVVERDNDFRIMQAEAKKGGFDLSKLPQAEKDLLLASMQGDPNVAEQIPERLQPINEILTGNVQLARPALVEEYINPMRAEYLRRIDPVILQAMTNAEGNVSTFPSLDALKTVFVEETQVKLADSDLNDQQRSEALSQAVQDFDARAANQALLLDRFFKFSSLADTIEGNVDTYTHNIYQIFTDDNFLKQRRADTAHQARVAAHIGQKLRGEGVLQNDGETDAAYQARLNGLGQREVDRWLQNEKAQYGLASPTTNVNALLKRSLNDPVISEFLGKVDDPFAVYASTMEQLGTLRANARFAERAFKSLQDAGIAYAQDPGDGRYQPLDLKDRQGFDMLQGVYVPADLRDAFQETFEQVQPDGASIQLYYKLNQMAKYGLTVASPPTGIRNFTFNAINGVANATFNPMVFWQSMKALYPTLNRKKAFSKEYRDAIKRGIVGESVTAGQLQSVMEDITRFDETRSDLQDFGNTKKKGPIGRVKQAADFLKRLYVYSDDVGKLMSYTVEKQNRAKARGLDPTDPAIEQEAAEIVKNTWPTYIRAFPIAKDLRKRPVSAFPTFILEVVRNSGNIVRQIQTDIRDPNPEIQKLGYKRMAGAFAVMAAVPAIVKGSAEALDMSPEEHEDACRTSLTRWQDCSTTIFLDRDENGYKTLDLKFFLPHIYLSAPLMALASDKNADITEALADSAEKVFDPFISPDVTVQRFLDAIRNKGGRIYNKNDSGTAKFLKQMKYVGEGAIPKLAKIPGEYYDALKGVKDRNGRTRSPGGVTARNLGYNPKQAYPLDSAKWGGYDYRKTRNASKQRVNDFLFGENRRNPTRDIAGLAEVIRQENERVEEKWANLQKTVAAIRRLPQNFPINIIELNVAGDKPSTGIGKKRARRLMDGFPNDPLGITKAQIKNYIRELKASTPPISKVEIDAIERQLMEIRSLFPE